MWNIIEISIKLLQIMKYGSQPGLTWFTRSYTPVMKQVLIDDSVRPLKVTFLTRGLALPFFYGLTDRCLASSSPVLCVCDVVTPSDAWYMSDMSVALRYLCVIIKQM